MTNNSRDIQGEVVDLKRQIKDLETKQKKEQKRAHVISELDDGVLVVLVVTVAPRGGVYR